MEFEKSFAALSEIPLAARHFRKRSTPPMTVSDLALVYELFLMDLRVSLFDLVSKEIFGRACSIVGSTMHAFFMWEL